MISKSTIKLIKSLAIKKYRIKEKLFLVEGDKNVLEVLHSKYIVTQLFATKTFITENLESLINAKQTVELIPEEIKKASLLQNPQNCFAVCTLPSTPELPGKLKRNLSLYLDGIQDPGNLGTIIRICDWFGIDHLFCSPDTSDLYNPKVIQASMGSFCRVNVYYTPFEPLGKLANDSKIPIYGAFLNGKNIYTEKLPNQALLVVGNEGKGIRGTVEEQITKKIMIPGLAHIKNSAESLNVSVATGIICGEFKRQSLF